MTAVRDLARARDYRVWSARVQRTRPAGSTGYVVYVVVLLVATYGSMAWSFLASLGAGGVGGAGVGERYAVLVFALLGLAAVAAARVGGPLAVLRRTAVHALSGQFRPRDVLRRRAVAILLAASLLGAFLAFAVMSGDGFATSALWALGAAGAGAVAVAVGALAQVRRWRGVVEVAVGAVVLLGLALVPVGVGGRVGPGAVVAVVAVVVAAVGWWVVLRLVPPRLDVDDVAARGARAARAGQGMAAGDTGAFGRGVPVRHRGARRLFSPTTTAGAGRVPAWTALARRAPILARDLVGQRRRPVSTAGGALAALLGAWLVVSGSQAALVAGALLLYGAAGALGLGLRAFLGQSAPGGLLPGHPRTVLAWHAVIPGLALAVAFVLAAGATLWAGAPGAPGAPGTPDLVTGAAMVVAALAVRAWAACGSVVPAVLNTPVVSPVGDLSVLNFAAYVVRGWLVVAGAGGLAGAAHDGQGWVVPLVAAGIFGALAARAVGR